MKESQVYNGINMGALYITQFYFDGAGIVEPWVQLFNMLPEEFENDAYIVAVWRIKLKTIPVLTNNLIVDTNFQLN